MTPYFLLVASPVHTQIIVKMQWHVVCKRFSFMTCVLFFDSYVMEDGTVHFMRIRLLIEHAAFAVYDDELSVVVLALLY